MITQDCSGVHSFDFLDQRMLEFPTNVCMIDNTGKSTIYFEEEYPANLLFISFPAHLILAFKDASSREAFFDSFDEFYLRTVCSNIDVELSVYSSFWWLN